MIKEIFIKNKNGENVKAVIKYLDCTYIEKIVAAEKNIYKSLDDKNHYCCSSSKEFQKILSENGKIVGCVIKDTNEIAGIGVYVCHGYNEHNYGYDLGIDGEKLLEVGQIESTFVMEDYRGNSLQNTLYEILEDISKNNGDKIIAATVHPENVYSLTNFKKRGYDVMLEKLKYGGLRRYILMKRF